MQNLDLVMPIENNLTPILPEHDYKKKDLKLSLATSLQCMVFNYAQLREKVQEEETQLNPGEEEEKGKDRDKDKFSAYCADPVTIKSFHHQCTIMQSKEKPKKITIKGSNGVDYIFLLKYDKQNDLRKEARFIDFCSLVNKMLESDTEARNSALKLRTYALVPLGRHSCMIEWIKNTATLKSIVANQWKLSGVKGDMRDVQDKA